MKYLGIDVGSTTVKLALLDENNIIVHKRYERHNARHVTLLLDLLQALMDERGDIEVTASVTGSAGMGIAERTGLPFTQEVIATGFAVETLLPGTDCVIELGGEDAKIVFFGTAPEQRMNGTCAGGTGAFIDQMATLMDVTPDMLNELAGHAEKVYPIASRCGVFAKTDIQPLLNQGARREDVAASVLQAVVDQTIGGLAQGRKIEGNVAFLGGPLAFLPALAIRFTNTLGARANTCCPPDAQYYVAVGCALSAREGTGQRLSSLIHMLETQTLTAPPQDMLSIPPLFADEAEYAVFTARHASARVASTDPAVYSGDAYLGVDAGSTTTKLVLITENDELLYSYYAPNRGSPVEVLREQLLHIRELCGDRIRIKSCAVTGYGEELMRAAFGIENGIVETVAHYMAAAYFEPEVDYVIDIGGQDMKCFRTHGGAIDSIMLNEACSSGCGSFIETFAKAIGYTTPDFAQLGLFAERPADLGSRCTVFMNSSVKQAQKEGASAADISAGLSISVVKNALYKVIRVVDPDELGRHIVVQGGTFINDAILRSFERELGREVTRPAIAGLMGAFGCALYAKSRPETDGLISHEELQSFTHTSQMANCGACENKCTLTINRFGGRRFVTGNRCERGAGEEATGEELPNLYAYTLAKLRGLDCADADVYPRGRVGIPFALNMFDTLPFWKAFFETLGVGVTLSPESSRELYTLGHDSIPSDTVCYPAKLVHGHIASLLRSGVARIFYPCAPYNNVEYSKADNFYNCPVVAYYPELVAANIKGLPEFIAPYLVVGRKHFAKKAFEALSEYFPDLTYREVKAAEKRGLAAADEFRSDVRAECRRAIDWARQHRRRIVVLAGRPYHIDREINHGLDRLITSLGLVVVTEEAVWSDGVTRAGKLGVLNQWTYHSRMYNAAHFAAANPDVELVQLVSFGCGIDAITGDELREILESAGKLYTQIKIDEISGQGAAKIRLRSLVAALERKAPLPRTDVPQTNDVLTTGGRI